MFVGGSFDGNVPHFLRGDCVAMVFLGGVIEVLDRADMEPDVVTGYSAMMPPQTIEESR
jgi:hypothetical protein